MSSPNRIVTNIYIEKFPFYDIQSPWQIFPIHLLNLCRAGSSLIKAKKKVVIPITSSPTRVAAGEEGWWPGRPLRLQTTGTRGVETNDEACSDVGRDGFGKSKEREESERVNL